MTDRSVDGGGLGREVGNRRDKREATADAVQRRIGNERVFAASCDAIDTALPAAHGGDGAAEPPAGSSSAA